MTIYPTACRTALALSLTLVTLVAAGSCASSAAMVRAEGTAAPASDTGTDSVTDTGTPPAEQPQPTPIARCIPVHDGECVPAADFEAAAEGLAAGYRAHPNFQTQWGLSHVGADHAYAFVNQIAGENAAPGAGVTIGFIDSGIDQNHPDFAGKRIIEFLMPGATNETGHGFSHGTAVASVAAGIRNLDEDSAHGVAWGADIAMFAIPTGSGDRPYNPITLSGLAAGAAWWAAVFDFVIAWRDGERRVDILNLSVGYDGVIDSYGEQELRDSFGPAIAALAQSGAADTAILVWAAGNAHGDPCDPATTANCVDGTVNAVSVEVLPGLATRIPELQGHSIAVVALQPDGTIADFSNRCGIAADNCIAAPGEEVRAAFLGPQRGTNVPSRGYADVRGTSFAAPFVAGGLAVMKQLFRDQLSNTELVTRLFATANDEGIYADRAVYGRGALDLRAATWPVGVLDVPVEGSRVDGPGVALGATSLRAGAAVGDGIERSLAGREIAAFDALGAPFWFDLGRFTTAGAARRRADEHRAFVDWPAPRADEPSPWRVGFADLPAGVDGGHLALAERALGLTLTDRRMLTGSVFTTGDGLGHTAVSGAALSWHPAGGPIGLHAGLLHEPESVLGSTGSGAFGTLAGETAFAGAALQAALGEWRLRAGAELGTVRAQPRGGIVSAVSPLTTSALSLQASTPFAAGGALSFAVSQPLRVEAGRAEFAVPAGRTRTGGVLRSEVAADLVPSGRQLEVAAQWDGPLAAGELRVGAAVTLQPGHRAGAAPELLLRGGWRWRH